MSSSSNTFITITVLVTDIGNDDGNRQKAEDDSSAAIADCDKNDVEQAGFDCIAIAANDVEIEIPEATLSVCKELVDTPGLEPDDFDFQVTGNNNPSPDAFFGDGIHTYHIPLA
jgi:hypothetical protein